MEQIDDLCHRFERLRHQQHQHMCTIQQNNQHIPTVAFQSLDTVRALHQTVVSLREALEEAHREIDTLRKRITVKDDIEEGKKFRQQFNKSNENQVDSSLKLELSTITDAEDQKHLDHTSSRIQTDQSTSFLKEHENKTDEVQFKNQLKKLSNLNEQHLLSSHKTATTQLHVTTFENQHKHILVYPIKTDIKIKTPETQTSQTSIPLPCKRLPQMASKIDVKIKLTSNFKIEDMESSSETTGESTGK